MGTAQQIHHKKLGKRFRIGALIISPLILVGVAAIVFQLSYGVKGEYALFDFNLGKLWSWAVNGKTPVEEVITTPKPAIVPAKPVRVVAPEAPVKQHEIQIPKPREAHALKVAENIISKSSADGLQSIEIHQVNPIAFNSNPRISSGKYIDPTEKEFLISPDIHTRRSKIAVGASFAPSLTFRNLRYSDVGVVNRVDQDGKIYTYGQSQEYRNKHDRPIMNFFTGLDVYYHINSHWTVQSGFYYMSFGEKLQVVRLGDDQYANHATVSEKSSFRSLQPLFDSPEMVQYDPDQKVPYSNYYGLIDIPFLVSYKCFQPSEQIKLEFQLGGSYAYLDHADALLYNYEANKYYWINSANFPVFNRNYLTGITGICASQYIASNIELFANPQFRYSYTSTFRSDYEIKQNQWAAGVRMGMKVHL